MNMTQLKEQGLEPEIIETAPSETEEIKTELDKALREAYKENIKLKKEIEKLRAELEVAQERIKELEDTIKLKDETIENLKRKLGQARIRVEIPESAQIHEIIIEKAKQIATALFEAKEIDQEYDINLGITTVLKNDMSLITLRRATLHQDGLFVASDGRLIKGNKFIKWTPKRFNELVKLFERVLNKLSKEGLLPELRYRLEQKNIDLQVLISSQ